MKRRTFLAAGCAHCAMLAGGNALAEAADWAIPARFTRPSLDSDEGGLWAFMDREEKRLRRSPFRMRDKNLRNYLHDIACRLAGQHCPDIRIYPVRTPWFNANMAPNGMMQIWSGLMLRVDNEAQLAAVIGHEIGHYLQRHAVEQLRDLRSRSAFGQFLGVALGGVGLIAQLALLAGQFSYSRDQEREADRIGLSLMRDAGYAPGEAAHVWRNLREEAAAAGDPEKHSVLFASHPAPSDREQTLEKLAGDAQGETGVERWRVRIDPYLMALLNDELRRGQYGETLVLLERLIARDGANGRLMYARGETYRMRAEEGDLTRAIDALDAAVDQPDAPAEAWRSLGLCQQDAKANEPARQAYLRYLEQAPDAPDAEMIHSYIQSL